MIHDPFSQELVADYYRQTHWQYRWLWTGTKSLALHYGYWTTGVTTHIDALHKLNNVLAEKVSIQRGDLVLDAGCGLGGSAIWLAQNRGAQVQGISIEPEQIDKARAQARFHNLTNLVTFSRQDYTQTNFAGGSFDVVWAIESVCHCRSKREFCREAYRLLKPGGRLVVADFFRSARPLPPQGEYQLHQWLQRWIVPDLDTLAEFAWALETEGFTSIGVEEATANIWPSARRLFILGVLTAPAALFFRLVGIHNRLQHDNWKSSFLQYRALRRGLWKYGIISAVKLIDTPQ